MSPEAILGDEPLLRRPIIRREEEGRARRMGRYPLVEGAVRRAAAPSLRVSEHLRFVSRTVLRGVKYETAPLNVVSNLSMVW